MAGSLGLWLCWLAWPAPVQPASRASLTCVTECGQLARQEPSRAARFAKVFQN